MAHTWLRNQRKQSLLELSEQAGLKLPRDLLKDEVIESLDNYLHANATRLRDEPAFEGYFGKTRTPARPQRESTAAFIPFIPPPGAGEEESEVKSVVKSRARRATRVKQEIEDDNVNFSSPVPIAAANSAPRTARRVASHAVSPGTSALSPMTTALSPSAQLTARTPAPPAANRRTSQLPGPPSPAVVADIIEAESTRFVAGVNDLWSVSGISENISHLRELCSSVVSVQLTFLLIEGFALQRRLIPWNFAFDVPATRLTNSYPVSLPDLFILLHGSYWSATIVWTMTSIIVPLTFAYFYNLTIREVKRGDVRVSVARYAADPLTYNVIKALTTWLVYGQGVSFGVISAEAVQTIDEAIWGGSNAVLIGSAIGALAALYEAAQRRVVS